MLGLGLLSDLVGVLVCDVVGFLMGGMGVPDVLAAAIAGVTMPTDELDAVTGVRLRDVTGPCGLLGGSCDLAPYSTYYNIQCKQSPLQSAINIVNYVNDLEILFF